MYIIVFPIHLILHINCLAFLKNNYNYLVTPNITSEVLDQTIIEEDTVSFTCQATGEPLPNISWFFNGVHVNNETNMDKYYISQSSINITITTTLTIMSVDSSDAGTYTCNATNVVSTDISSGILTVNG